MTTKKPDTRRPKRTIAEQVADRKIERKVEREAYIARRKARGLPAEKVPQKVSRRKANKKYMAKKQAEKRAAYAALPPEEKRKLKEQRSRQIMVNHALSEKLEITGNNVIGRELARRELCRRRLIASTVRFNSDYLAGWVHKDLCTRIERFMSDVLAGLSPRLMVQMPPRHGKSRLTSIELPAWGLGNYPHLEFILCSYSASLAMDFSREVRERLRDPEYQVIFPNARLDKNNQNAEGWRTEAGGGFLPAGVGGPITGKGAHVLIIDDPIKNYDEAESDIIRESIWNWYGSTAYTRLAPGGGVLIIQTRWHDDDLSGRLERVMKQGDGDKFEIVRYPAVAMEDEQYRKRDEALHPARYPIHALRRIEKAVGPRTWSALYQQAPVLDDGSYFQKDMFKFYDPDKPPEELTSSQAWDLAIGQKQQNDWTVGAAWGRSMTDEFYLQSVRRGRWDATQIIDEMCDLYVRYDPDIVGLERGVIAQSLGPALSQAIRERKLNGFYVEELTVGRRDKVARARTLQSLMRQGRVYFPDPVKAPWVVTVMNELLRFPNGAHDDIVDALAWLALMIEQTSLPSLPYSNLPARISWRDRLPGIVSDAQRKTFMSA